jgi:hypothetical protein
MRLNARLVGHPVLQESRVQLPAKRLFFFYRTVVMCLGCFIVRLDHTESGFGSRLRGIQGHGNPIVAGRWREIRRGKSGAGSEAFTL